jgi:undecaprenyl-diphosphatase
MDGMEHLLPSLTDLARFGVIAYWLVFLFSFVESLAFVGIAFPGTVLAVIAGALSAQGGYDFSDFLLFAIAGAILGDAISYELGKRGSRWLERKSTVREYLKRGETFIRRHGGKSIFLGRFAGPLRAIVPFAAGMMKMPSGKFYVSNILSAIAWSFTYLTLGYIFGTAWKIGLLWFTRAGILLFVLAFVAALIGWFWKWFSGTGRSAWDVLLTVARSARDSFLSHPDVRRFVERHPRFIRFVRERFSTRHLTGLPFTILAALFLVTVTMLLGIVQDYIARDPLIAFDLRLANLLYAFRSPPLLTLFYAVTLLGSSAVVIITAMALSAALLTRNRKEEAITLWITIVGTAGLTFLSKLAFHRIRPEGILPTLISDSFSFPSGHAANAASLYGFLAYLVIRTYRSWRVRVLSLFGCALLIFLIDLSRLYLGVHFLSDVLAGNLLSFAVLLFAISVGEWLRVRRRSEPRPIPLSSFPLVLAAACASATVIFVAEPPVFLSPPATQLRVVEENAVPGLFATGTLPVSTETMLGTPQEPVNLIIVGSEKCLEQSLAHAGWKRAEPVSFSSLYRLAGAAIQNAQYPTAPMTPSFYDARPHDIGFERETDRGSVRNRHHARFWRTIFHTKSGDVFIGTASLDIGIRWLVTHTIAPDIDTERTFLLQNLKSANAIANQRLFPIVPPTLGKNAIGDQFFTDGKAAFLALKPCR